MKALRVLSTAMSALLAVASANAGAQLPSIGIKVAPPPHGGRMRRGHGGFFIIEREVVRVVEREVVREDKPAEPPVAPPAPPRQPYVIGRSYSSLPGRCMKLLDEGVSYYRCSGEWYRQIGAGSAAQYTAVAHSL